MQSCLCDWNQSEYLGDIEFRATFSKIKFEKPDTGYHRRQVEEYRRAKPRMDQQCNERSTDTAISSEPFPFVTIVHVECDKEFDGYAKESANTDRTSFEEIRSRLAYVTA